MKQKSKLLCLLGALAILISLLAPTEGLTAGKPSVTIHNIIDLTGAYAPIAIPSEKGGKDYLAWIAAMHASCQPTRDLGWGHPNPRSLRCGLHLIRK